MPCMLHTRAAGIPCSLQIIVALHLAYTFSYTNHNTAVITTNYTIVNTFVNTNINTLVFAIVMTVVLLFVLWCAFGLIFVFCVFKIALYKKGKDF